MSISAEWGTARIHSSKCRFDTDLRGDAVLVRECLFNGRHLLFSYCAGKVCICVCVHDEIMSIPLQCLPEYYRFSFCS